MKDLHGNGRGVKAVVELPFKEDTFLSGSDPWNLFGGSIPKCKVLAIRLCTEHGGGLSFTILSALFIFLMKLVSAG